MYRDAIIRDYSEQAEMVGLCDSNAGRLRLALETVQEKDNLDLPGYSAEEFDRMVAENKPDCVIVTSMDRTHDRYICRAMELGCDVITEKPMTIDSERCQRILDTRKKTGKKCRVTFNYRYSPPRSQVKDLLMSGIIGEVLSVDFHWMLDTSHGADYFRRWHRTKGNSGGLMVHKATHHFDLVNWWISSVPKTVYAVGHRRFYTPKTADRYGLRNRSERCHDCLELSRCPFKLKMADNESLRRLYLDCEEYDGYFRDQCVFSERIDIEDSMNLVVSYENGVKMSYSLNAFCPWEGHFVVFNGTRGRLEHKCEETVYINADGSVPGALKREGTWTRIYPHWRPAYEVEIWDAEGGHGGGDSLLLEDIFNPDIPADRFLRAADERAGSWSILTGISANRSMDTGTPVRVRDLVSGLELPDYPPMPQCDEPLRVET
jgi:predicted dehydrogenase